MNNRFKIKKRIPLEKRFTIRKRFQPKPRIVSSNITSEQRNILELVNRHRRRGFTCNGEYHPPVKELRWNNNLFKAALSHAQDMANYNYFEHKGLNGSTAMQGIIASEFQGNYYGENISAGRDDFSNTIIGLF